MQENVKRTCEELRNDFPEIEILSGVFNLSKEDEVEALSSLVQSKWNKLDVLVNNAGVFLGGSVLGEKNGRLEYLLNTNLLSAYRLTRSLKELFIRQKKRIYLQHVLYRQPRLLSQWWFLWYQQKRLC